jgi:hypothetical protein
MKSSSRLHFQVANDAERPQCDSATAMRPRCVGDAAAMQTRSQHSLICDPIELKNTARSRKIQARYRRDTGKITKKISFIDVFYHQIRNGIQGCTTRAPPLSRGGRVRYGDQTIATICQPDALTTRPRQTGYRQIHTYVYLFVFQSRYIIIHST